MHDSTNSIWTGYPAAVYALFGKDGADHLPLRELYKSLPSPRLCHEVSEPLRSLHVQDILWAFVPLIPFPLYFIHPSATPKC